jgi:2-oxo-4-hydroxy-4-carboxy--5-ureidoimidazoline (OHCU) decarboxylase
MANRKVAALVNHHQWPFDNPASTPGSEAEVLACFRRVRDEMRRAFEAYAAGLREGVILRWHPRLAGRIGRHARFSFQQPSALVF